MKRLPEHRDIDECADKLYALLDEYNAEIYIDNDFGLSLADIDNKDAVFSIASHTIPDFFEKTAEELTAGLTIKGKGNE